MGWINNQEVLGKLRQVLNEVLVLKEEEAARSIELIKQLNALTEKVDAVNKRVGDLNCKVGLLNGRVDELNEHAGTLEGFIKNGATKPMMEMLGKKVNEIGKTVNDHFESFVKVSEKDTELFKLIAQALTGKVVEEEASAEPKLTEKAKKNERRKKKNEGAKEAKKTASGTDGNSGNTEEEVDGLTSEKNFDIVTGQRVSVNAKAGFIHISKKHLDALYKWGFTHVAKVRYENRIVHVIFDKKKGGKVCKDGRIYCASLVGFLEKIEGDMVISNLYINKKHSEMLVMKFPKKVEQEKK